MLRLLSLVLLTISAAACDRTSATEPQDDPAGQVGPAAPQGSPGAIGPGTRVVFTGPTSGDVVSHALPPRTASILPSVACYYGTESDARWTAATSGTCGLVSDSAGVSVRFSGIPSSGHVYQIVVAYLPAACCVRD